MGEHVCSGCRQRPCVCETVVLPTADNDAPVPGHDEWSVNLTIPRQYTERGGWNINCECGYPLGDTGHSEEEQQARYLAHLAEVTRVIPPGVCRHDGGRFCPRGTPDCDCPIPPADGGTDG